MKRIRRKHNELLITGVLSGLGKHIYEQFSGIAWDRHLLDKDRGVIKRTGADTIIHCASNSSQEVNSDALYGYFEDNVLLTEELVEVPHRKFIFISSVDVFPNQKGFHREDEIIDVNNVVGIYAVTKLMSEAIVRQHCSNYLILRCTSLLGKYSRKNSLIKILEDEPCKLTLTQDSRFNYVLHSDVTSFIEFAIKNDLQGIYNVSSSGSVTLKEVATMLGKRVQFGKYNYDVGNIDNRKITSIFPTFKKTSREIVTQFIREREI